MAEKDLLVHLEYLRAAVDGVNERLDILNGRTRKLETDVAILHDRADRVTEIARDSKHRAVRLGAALGAGIAAVISGVAQYFLSR